MKRKYLCISGILIGLLMMALPCVSAIEQNTITNYNQERLSDLSLSELKELVEAKLNDQEPNGLITIAIHLLYSIFSSLFYVIPALLYLVLTLII